MISEASVRRAINHLGALGDTDLFPRLPEMRCFLERPGTIAKDCEKLNIGQYTPTGSVETLTPKSWLGFRIAHQLTASDNVIYLAALLDCAPHLEAVRLPKDDNEAFAYRYVEGEAIRIFEGARGYHQWLAHLSDFGGPDNPFAEDRPAIATDISDFYQRIYFHRIENVLQDAGCPKGPAELIKKVIKTSRARCQRRSDSRPAWRRKSRPLMARRGCLQKGPRSGGFLQSGFGDGGQAWVISPVSGSTAGLFNANYFMSWISSSGGGLRIPKRQFF